MTQKAFYCRPAIKTRTVITANQLLAMSPPITDSGGDTGGGGIVEADAPVGNRFIWDEDSSDDDGGEW